ncbi:hypothetical protein E4U61_003670 [Claviceps capensis]|nr:hypothetical protein E4U61_003670 [Claviceps capensis]
MAHNGYLVGYAASNFYRIWVPSLGRVVTTRNVTFDENIFYDPLKEGIEAQSRKELESLCLSLQIDKDIEEVDLMLSSPPSHVGTRFAPPSEILSSGVDVEGLQAVRLTRPVLSKPQTVTNKQAINHVLA